jgi:hypothetical protein
MGGTLGAWHCSADWGFIGEQIGLSITGPVFDLSL